MTMTKKQRETIAQNLNAFIHNFGPIRFERADYGPGFSYTTQPTPPIICTLRRALII